MIDKEKATPLGRIMTEYCLYKKIGFVGGTERMRYKSACGLDVVQMDHEVWNGFKHRRHDICGFCMKCKKQIKIIRSDALEEVDDE